MKIQVLFFGATADISGMRTVELMVEQGLRSDAFLRQMVERFPALASHKIHLAINQQYANGDEVIRNGDELAIFTAVSGG